jgi:hypothetical protein
MITYKMTEEENVVNTSSCPLRNFCPNIRLNKDFFYGSTATILFSVGYWYIRCKDRKNI